MPAALSILTPVVNVRRGGARVASKGKRDAARRIEMDQAGVLPLSS